MRFKLLVAYTGTAYSGWQIQEKPSPPPTIQGELERALSLLARHPVRVYGAGRTDAGVHAHGQTAHCDLPEDKIPCWRRSLNALLPPSIRILEASPASPDFHARKDAVSKTYIYHFWQEHNFVPPGLIPFVWVCGPLNLSTMRDALPHLLGRQDFASLQNTGTDMESTVRSIKHISLDIMPSCEFYPTHMPMLRLSISADGFLKQMVRNIAGLLVACGRGKVRPGDIPGLLAACDRRVLPSITAPARGLALATVRYA